MSWRRDTLGNACRIFAGYGFPERLQGQTKGEIPFYKVGDISEAWKKGETYLTTAKHYLTEAEARELKAKPLPTGTTVFAKIGAAIALNRRAMLAQPALVDNNVMGLLPATVDLEPKFLFHFVCTLRLNELSRATTVPSIRKTDVEQIELTVPPIEEQQHIVAEIEEQFMRLDAGVASLKRVQTQLKRYCASVLKAACDGRLVPTEAELARKENRSYETGQELLQRILKERREKWNGNGKNKEPAAPDIPDLSKPQEGWTWATLDQLCPRFVDSAHRTPKYGPAGSPALGPRDVVGGKLNLQAARLVNEHEFKIQTARHIPEAGDIIYSRELSLGWGVVVPEGVRLCLSQGMCLFHPHSDIDLRYFLAMLNGPAGRKHAEDAATGSAHPHLNLGDIKRYVFPLPPHREQQRIVAEIDRRLSVIEKLEAVTSTELQRATRLRQSVLQQAFSGEI